MKIVKQAVATCESILASSIPKGEPGWQAVPTHTVIGRTTWSTVIFDFEDQAFELGVTIPHIQIGKFSYTNVRPINIISGSVVECSIESALLM